jgi:hypothetical protein
MKLRAWPVLPALVPTVLVAVLTTVLATPGEPPGELACATGPVVPAAADSRAPAAICRIPPAARSGPTADRELRHSASAPFARH